MIAEAAQIAESLRIQSPKSAATWVSLGHVAFAQERFQIAAQHFERALELDPLDRSTMTTLARAYQRLGDAARFQRLISRIASLGGPFGN